MSDTEITNGSILLDGDVTVEALGAFLQRRSSDN